MVFHISKNFCKPLFPDFFDNSKICKFTNFTLFSPKFHPLQPQRFYSTAKQSFSKTDISINFILTMGVIRNIGKYMNMLWVVFSLPDKWRIFRTRLFEEIELIGIESSFRNRNHARYRAN